MEPKIRKAEVVESEASPPYDELQEGIYVLVNKATRTVLYLDGGKAANGTRVQGWQRLHDKWFGDSRWVLKRLPENGKWTLSNLKSATFLDVEGGYEENGSQVVGRVHRPNNMYTQNLQWGIKHHKDDYYTLQNITSNTFLELDKGSSANGTRALCSTLVDVQDNQLWIIEKASRTVEEIIGIVGDWNEAVLPRLCQVHSLDTRYFVLPDDLRKTIWESTGLRTQPVRNKIFDHDQFVVKAKDAMGSWVRDNFQSEGYALLFGLIYGQAERGPTAYNWYLSQDLESVVFFDAQAGTEHMPSSLNKRGFKPTFAVF